jgi:hypothetical protein
VLCADVSAQPIRSDQDGRAKLEEERREIARLRGEVAVVVFVVHRYILPRCLRLPPLPRLALLEGGTTAPYRPIRTV